ncbi:MAG: peptidoglycan DD-metalloendopeptidase family protein [Roseburia sp.]|nr:peptidoglycan DD-metalloendopeptidase family protein [Roseburia sp.]
MKKMGIIASLILALSLTAIWHKNVQAMNLSSITSRSIQEKQDQISQAEKEKENLKNNLSDLQVIKNQLEAQKSDLKNYVVKLDGSLAEIEQNIADLESQIDTKTEEIAKVEAELKVAQEEEDNQKDSMINRIRLMYEQKDRYMSELLLDAQGLKDMVNRADYMENIMSYDRQQWEKFQETRQLVELCKEEIELEKELLNQTREHVEIEQNNLELLISQKQNDIIAYETDISTKEKAIREYEEEIAAQDEEIKLLEQAIAEEKRRIIASNGKVITYDGGVFQFPLETYTRVSDDYGMRMHPTLGVEKFHNGVDFAAPAGTPIYAAYDGVVVAATYSGTMGNYVMIDHGDSLYTIYMHASKLYVSKDDVVIRGETIAGVGTTGRSTGNHLHFGVRKDGDYVSPWNYISE